MAAILVLAHNMRLKVPAQRSGNTWDLVQARLNKLLRVQDELHLTHPREWILTAAQRLISGGPEFHQGSMPRMEQDQGLAEIRTPMGAIKIAET